MPKRPEDLTTFQEVLLRRLEAHGGLYVWGHEVTAARLLARLGRASLRDNGAARGRERWRLEKAQEEAK